MVRRRRHCFGLMVNGLLLNSTFSVLKTPQSAFKYTSPSVLLINHFELPPVHEKCFKIKLYYYN